MSELEVLYKIYDKIKDTDMPHIDVPFQMSADYSQDIKLNYSFNYMLWLLFCYNYDVEELNKHL